MMSVNTHSAAPHRYEAHRVCFGVISFPNMERDHNPSCHSSPAARLPSTSHAGDVYGSSFVLRCKRTAACARDSSLEAQMFAAREKST